MSRASTCAACAETFASCAPWGASYGRSAESQSPPMNVAAKKFYQDGFMDLSKYRLERSALDAEWDAAVELSPQGTLFATSPVLSCLQNVHPGLWTVFKDRQAVAALCVIEAPDGRRAVENDFVVYAGLMLAPSPPEQSPAQTVAEQFRIASFCTGQLAELYEDAFVAFAPTFVDIRPFLWHNYGREGLHFVPDVRFTSLIALAPRGGEGLDADPHVGHEVE